MASKRPDGDVWNIVDNDEMSQHYGRNFKFDFSYISSDEIKGLFKDYVWQNYRVGNKTLSSLYIDVNSYFYRFIQFADTRNITSLKGLALQLQVIEPDTDLNSIMIGNSNYNDDVWDLRPFITAKSTKESHKYIRFEYIADVDMKETVKQYAYYKLGKIKPQTVREYINGRLPMFIEYCSLNGIHSFADVTLEDYLNFNLWMKNDKKVAVGTGNSSCHVVEEIIRIGQIKGWNVPTFHLPKAETANQLWNTRKSMKTNKTKPIPEDVFDKILYHAVHDENDVLTKAGIIIQSQTSFQ